MIKVNNIEITEKEVDLACNDLKNRIKAPKLKREYIEGVINQLIEARLLIEDAKKQNITVSDEEVEKIYKKIVHNFRSEKEFLEILKKYGDTVEEIKYKIYEDLILKKYIDKITENIEVKDEDVISYYNENINNFKKENVVRASHILFDKNDYDLAMKVKSEIEQGASFEEKAKEYSKCPSKEKGGDLGYFQKGILVEELDEVCFRAPLGIVTDPIKTKFGYHLIKVYDKKKEIFEPFENVKEELKKHLKNTLINYNIEKIANELKKGAVIEIDKEKLEKKIKFWEETN